MLQDCKASYLQSFKSLKLYHFENVFLQLFNCFIDLSFQRFSEYTFGVQNAIKLFLRNYRVRMSGRDGLSLGLVMRVDCTRPCRRSVGPEIIYILTLFITVSKAELNYSWLWKKCLL
jgi:hypothetical protein